MKAPTPLFSMLVGAAAVGADLSGGFLAVALAAEASSLPRARLLRLATAEARALDPQALIQQEAGAVVAPLALSEPLGRVDRLELAERLLRRLAAATDTVISAGVSNIASVGDTRQLGRACGLALAALSAGRRALGPGRTTNLRGLTARAVLALLAVTPELDLFC